MPPITLLLKGVVDRLHNRTMAKYTGNELELFAHATNWKRYYARRIKPGIGARVLEVGAGIGETTRHLCAGTHQKWVCLESDEDLCDQVRGKISSGGLPPCCSVVHGTVDDLGVEERFDSIIYVDVLEHIEDDQGELARASGLVAPGGSLIVMAPAQQCLYSAFDRRIGHYRRYDRQRLKKICPPGFFFERLEYLDSIGTLALLANRLLLKQTTPKLWQVALWDGIMVPLSRCVDPLLCHGFGKSILAVMSRRGTGGLAD